MNKSSHRSNRNNSDIERALSEIIRKDLKDPRIGLITSVVKTDTTKDLKECKVYISVFGDDEKKQETISAIKNAGGFIRYRLAQTLNLRNTPELHFILDDSIEYGVNMTKKINDIVGTEVQDTDGE